MSSLLPVPGTAQGAEWAFEIPIREHRLALAGQELEAVAFFDYAIVNDDLEECVDAVLEIVEAERSGQVSPVRSRFGRAQTLEKWKGFRT